MKDKINKYILKKSCNNGSTKVNRDWTDIALDIWKEKKCK